jgi:hypothetical protein
MCEALHSDLNLPGLAGADRYLNSYESLPPNFSLVQNMVAGAFAGIAVSGLQTGSNSVQLLGAKQSLGAHCHVPH